MTKWMFLLALSACSLLSHANQGFFQTWSDEIQSLSSDEAAVELAHKIIETVAYGDEDQSVLVMGALRSFSDDYFNVVLGVMLNSDDCRVRGFAMTGEPAEFYEKYGSSIGSRLAFLEDTNKCNYSFTERTILRVVVARTLIRLFPQELDFHRAFSNSILGTVEDEGSYYDVTWALYLKGYLLPSACSCDDFKEYSIEYFNKLNKVRETNNDFHKEAIFFLQMASINWMENQGKLPESTRLYYLQRLRDLGFLED